MTEFEKIEKRVNALTKRVQAFHNGDWVHVGCSGSSILPTPWRAWTNLGKHKFEGNGNTPDEALDGLDAQLRIAESHTDNLAKTLGLEAAQ